MRRGPIRLSGRSAYLPGFDRISGWHARRRKRLGKKVLPRISSSVVGPLQTNCYILSCPYTAEAIIVDPGADAEVIAALVDQANLKPVMIVATHGHSDHIGGVAALQRRYGIDFALHESDIDIVKRSIKEAPLWGLGTIEEPDITKTFKDGDEISFGRVTGKILHTPGHTIGGISILFEKFVIVGDTLFRRSVGRTDLYSGNMDDLTKSIKDILFKLPDETEVFCGHGQPTTIGEEKRDNPFVYLY